MTKKTLTILIAIGLLAAVLVRRVHAHNAKMDVGHHAAAPNMSADDISVEEFYPVLMIITTQPMEIPGRVLEAGDYIFALTSSDHEVVVSKLDASEYYGPYRTVPSRRGNYGEATLITETVPGVGPDRITAWYPFPGQRDGYAFQYPNAWRSKAKGAQEE